MLFSLAQASASEALGPTIDHTSVTDFTEHGATLQAQINPQGSETEYEFRLIWQDAAPPGPGERVTGGPQAQTGHLAAGFADQTVSATVTDLQPGYTYWYTVAAINAAGRTKSEANLFGFQNGGAYPEGTGTGPPYESEVPLFYLRLSEEESSQTLREYEAKQQRAAKEQEERQASEAARRSIEEAALKRLVDEAAAPPLRVLTCDVPSLKGRTLRAARRALERAYCRLGRVARPRHYNGALIVVAQSPRRGRKLTHGAAIALTLGSSR